MRYLYSIPELDNRTTGAEFQSGCLTSRRLTVKIVETMLIKSIVAMLGTRTRIPLLLSDSPIGAR